MIVEPVTVEGEFLTVSLIVWRRFRRPNPGLADLGAFLPVGTTFDMPVPTPREPAILDPIRLW
jgi:phage tail protein X